MVAFRWQSVVAFLLLPSLLIAGEERQFRVSIEAPIVIAVDDWQRLIALCGQKKRVYGCRWFQGEQLPCGCQSNGDAWVIVATATALPVMYVSKKHFGEHEELHIRDIEESLGKYLERLTSRRFKSAQSCHRVAVAESARFVKMMNELRSESNRKYNCGGGARSSSEAVMGSNRPRNVLCATGQRPVLHLDCDHGAGGLKSVSRHRWRSHSGGRQVEPDQR